MSIRTERVARLYQREVASLLSIDFAAQLPAMVTVTNARVTKDLSICYVYVSILGATDAERQATFQHLQRLGPHIRTTLAARIRHQVRIIPELRFFLDETLEEAQKMEDIFEKIRSERQSRPGSDDPLPHTNE